MQPDELSLLRHRLEQANTLRARKLAWQAARSQLNLSRLGLPLLTESEEGRLRKVLTQIIDSRITQYQLEYERL